MELNLSREKNWWDERSLDLDDLRANTFDPNIGNQIDCLDQILPSLNLNHRSTVLDLGCGMGRLSNFLVAYYDIDVVGVDISPEILDVARRGAPSRDNPTYLVSDGQSLPPGTPPLDGAYSICVFQHIDPVSCQAYIRGVGWYLKAGCNFRFQYVPGDEHEFLDHKHSQQDVLSWCAKAGLQVVSIDTGLLHPHWEWITTEAS